MSKNLAGLLTSEEQETLLGSTPTPVDDKKRPSQADLLVSLALQIATFFHDQEGEPYAAIPVSLHREVVPLRSRHFKRWLAQQFFDLEERAPNTDSMSQALQVLEGYAVFRGSKHALHLRVAEYDGAFWYDLADPEWRAVRVTPEGWEVVSNPPILFRRHLNTAAQVTPEPGGEIRELFRLMNVRSEADKNLLAVYLVTALVPGTPKPILNVFGEKGSGKSTLMRMLRQLIDPAVEPLLIPRHDEREFAIQLAHNFAPFYDNLSSLSQLQSDMLCRAATGAGFTTRALYTDSEEVLFRLRRCVGVNGIHLLSGGTDLLDRYLVIELERLPEEERREERDILEEFERLRPRLFGAMLSTLSAAMGIKPALRFDKLPRMADFAAWGAAVAEALDIGADAFLAAYWQNIGQVNERLLESHPVAAAVLALLRDSPEWKGTPSELLEALEAVAQGEKISTKSKLWPKSANSLSRRLKEVASNLADAGIRVTCDRAGHSRTRTITIEKISSASSARKPEAREAASGAASGADGSADDSADGIELGTQKPSAKPSALEPSNDKHADGADGADGILRQPLGEAWEPGSPDPDAAELTIWLPCATCGARTRHRFACREGDVESWYCTECGDITQLF